MGCNHFPRDKDAPWCRGVCRFVWFTFPGGSFLTLCGHCLFLPRQGHIAKQPTQTLGTVVHVRCGERFASSPLLSNIVVSLWRLRRWLARPPSSSVPSPSVHSPLPFPFTQINQGALLDRAIAAVCRRILCLPFEHQQCGQHPRHHRPFNSLRIHRHRRLLHLLLRRQRHRPAQPQHLPCPRTGAHAAHTGHPSATSPPPLAPLSRPQPAAANEDTPPIQSGTIPMDVDAQMDPMQDVDTPSAPMDVDSQPRLPFPGQRVNNEWEVAYLKMWVLPYPPPFLFWRPPLWQRPPHPHSAEGPVPRVPPEHHREQGHAAEQPQDLQHGQEALGWVGRQVSHACCLLTSLSLQNSTWGQKVPSRQALRQAYGRRHHPRHHEKTSSTKNVNDAVGVHYPRRRGKL